jgi:hypothetical protein
LVVQVDAVLAVNCCVRFSLIVTCVGEMVTADKPGIDDGKRRMDKTVSRKTRGLRISLLNLIEYNVWNLIWI